MTRRLLLLSLVAFGLVPRRANAGGASSELLQKRLEQIELQSRLGTAHPKLRSLRQTVTGLEAAGMRIDPAEAEQEFLRLFAVRGELRQTFGLDHPRVVTTTQQIAFLAGLLADRNDLRSRPTKPFGTLAGGKTS